MNTKVIIKLISVLLICLLPFFLQAQISITGLVRAGQPCITDTSIEKTEGYVLLYTTVNDSLVVVSKKATRINYYQNGFKMYNGSLPPDPDGSIPAVNVIRTEIIKNLLKSEILINGVLFKSYKFVSNSEIIK